jgi:hypothetical protein
LNTFYLDLNIKTQIFETYMEEVVVSLKGLTIVLG